MVERCWTCVYTAAPRYGRTQRRAIANAAATTAATRARMNRLRLIDSIPADAERADRQQQQPRRRHLQRKLREAEHEQPRGQRPAQRARERRFGSRRGLAPARA